MLDEIYLRLLLELLPANLKLSSWDINRMLEQGRDSDHASRVYADLIHQLYRHEPNSNIGLRFGQHLHPATLCDFSRALMTSPNFKTVLSLIERYHYLHGASYYPSIAIDAEQISIALTYPYKERVSMTQRRFCAEGVFSYVVNALRETVDQQLQPKAIYFDFAQPDYFREYEAHFDCEIVFGQPLAMLVMNTQFIERDLSTSNATLHPLYLNKCLDHWRRSARQCDFQYRVMIELMQQHPHSFSSQTLADQLNISVRGLQKRLSKHQQSFSQLTARARRELVKVYLYQHGASVEVTAEKLGFQTSSGFRRFFRSEFDMTPAEFSQLCLQD